MPSLRFSQISHAHISARKTPAREGGRKEERERKRELRVWKTVCVCVCMKEKCEREFVEERKSVSVCVLIVNTRESKRDSEEETVCVSVYVKPFFFDFPRRRRPLVTSF